MPLQRVQRQCYCSQTPAQTSQTRYLGLSALPPPTTAGACLHRLSSSIPQCQPFSKVEERWPFHFSFENASTCLYIYSIYNITYLQYLLIIYLDTY